MTRCGSRAAQFAVTHSTGANRRIDPAVYSRRAKPKPVTFLKAKEGGTITGFLC